MNSLERWQAAQLEYRQECAWHKRYLANLLKGRTVEQLSPEELQLLYIGKIRRSNASKKRADEERVYFASLNPINERTRAIIEKAKELNDLVNGVKPSQIALGKTSLEEQDKARMYKEWAESNSEEARRQQVIKDTVKARAEGRFDELTGEILKPGEKAYAPKPLNREIFNMPAPVEPEEPEQPSTEEPPDPFGDPINDAAMDTDPDPPLERVVVPEPPIPAPKAKASPQIKKLGLDSESLREHPLFSEEAARAAAAYVPPVPEHRMNYQSISREEWEQTDEYKQIQEQLQKEQALGE